MADESFEIISYVSGRYSSCLAITLPTWLDHTQAQIVIYTDEQAERLPENGRVIWRPLFQGPAQSAAECFERKITVLLDAYACRCSHYFCWLDADVMAVSDFSEAFAKLGSNEIGGTRLFNSLRGRGDANAGVIFFQRSSELEWFFKDWQQLSARFKVEGRGGLWYEQASATQLMREAFHGRRSYSAAALSEELYNLEDDNTKQWFRRIEQNRPKLIHLKNGRWGDASNIKRLAELTPQIRAYYASKS